MTGWTFVTDNLRPHSARRRTNTPAPTITSRDTGNRVWEPDHQAQKSVRTTVAEVSALQTYPDGFPWQGATTKQYLQVGNAVPPLLAQVVLAALWAES